MRIVLNGKQLITAVGDLAALLLEQGIAGEAVATAVNGQFVPRGQRQQQQLHEGARVEVLAPMQGG